MSSSYTCLSCRVFFECIEKQREHYKGEWHRYNVKRKVVQLPPITYQAYHQLELSHQNKEQLNREKANEGGAGGSNYYCKCCCKQFANERAYEQHNQSKKHREIEANCNISVESNKAASKLKELNVKYEKEVDDDSDWESVQGDESYFRVKLDECLFCPFQSKTIDANLDHMSKKHHFFLPDLEYIIDLNGLLTHLKKKVGYYYMCLWCSESGKSFYSIEATQKHMQDKGHCKMKYELGESFLEYQKFFDYSSSYPDAEDADKDDEVDVMEIGNSDDWELQLPSGATIGHRSLTRYYKQNLKPQLSLQQQSRRNYILDKVKQRYMGLGWTGTSGKAAVQRAKDLQYMNRIQAKRNWRIGVGNNKNKQPHFRSQIFF